MRTAPADAQGLVEKVAMTAAAVTQNASVAIAPQEPNDWALRFENQARELLRVGRFPPLVAYEDMAETPICRYYARPLLAACLCACAAPRGGRG